MKQYLSLLLRLFLTLVAGVVLAPGEVHAQNVLRCLASTNQPTVAVNTTSAGTSGQTINITIRFACTSTTSGTKTGRLTATLGFLDNANVATGTFLTSTTGPLTIPYTFNRNIGPLTTTPSATFPSCTGSAPSQISNGSITLITNASVTGPGSFSIQNYYLNACVRIPTQSVATANTFVGKLRISTSGFVVSGGGSFQSSTNNDASVMTATIPASCTVGSLPNLNFNYTSFTNVDSTLSQPLSTVSCNSGSWTVDIRDQGAASVTNPLVGTVRGIQYRLGLSNTSTVPAIGALNPVFPISGTMSGQQTLHLLGRAPAGQAGDANCLGPCVTSRTYTLTITFN